MYITNAMLVKDLYCRPLGQITARPLARIRIRLRIRVRVRVRVRDGPCPRGLDKNFSLDH